MEQVDRKVLRGLMLSWLLVVLVFFSIPSSKLVGYVIAALPPLAWFIQETFEQRLEQQAPGVDRSIARHAAIAVVICGLAVVALVVFPQRSTKSLAQIFAAQARPGDQVVMLNQFAYDLPLYADWREPIAVVSNWDDPGLRQADDWRLELFDAARFEPSLGQRLLWSPARLQRFLCAPGHPVTWLLAYLDEADRFPVLAGRKPEASSRKMGLWQIPAGAAVSGCAETPRSAPE